MSQIAESEALPADLLSAYHRLLDKKFGAGLTPDEERDLERVTRELGEADMATPREREIHARAKQEHERQMAILNDMIARLQALEER